MGLLLVFYIDINVFVDGQALNCHIDHVLEGLVEVVADPVDNEIIENSFNFISFKFNFQIRPSDSIEIDFDVEIRYSKHFQVHFKFTSISKLDLLKLTISCGPRGVIR